MNQDGIETTNGNVDTVTREGDPPDPIGTGGNGVRSSPGKAAKGKTAKKGKGKSSKTNGAAASRSDLARDPARPHDRPREGPVDADDASTVTLRPRPPFLTARSSHPAASRALPTTGWYRHRRRPPCAVHGGDVRGPFCCAGGWRSEPLSSR